MNIDCKNIDGSSLKTLFHLNMIGAVWLWRYRNK